MEDRAAVTAGRLLVAIIFSQAPHFSFVQRDIVVDPEVVQPAVITFRVDLDKRTQASKGSLCGEGTTSLQGPGLQCAVSRSPGATLFGNGNDSIYIKTVIT